MTDETVFCAVPYNRDYPSFFFESIEEYQEKYKAQSPCEEYEIQLVLGSPIARLFIEQDGVTGAEKYLDIESELRQIHYGAFKYLLEELKVCLDTAIEHYEDVNVYDDTLLNYWRDEVRDRCEIDDWLFYYLDFDWIVKDESSDIHSYEYKLHITNVEELNELKNTCKCRYK
jgi:hypothetical protein